MVLNWGVRLKTITFFLVYYLKNGASNFFVVGNCAAVKNSDFVYEKNDIVYCYKAHIYSIILNGINSLLNVGFVGVD